MYEQELFEKELYKNLEQEQQIKNSLKKTYHQRQLALKESLIDMIPIDATQSDCQKKETSTTLYHVDKIEISPVQMSATENFLVDNLSQVIK